MVEFGFINIAVNNFFLQILFVSLLFCRRFEKRSCFYLRFFGSALFFMALAFFFPKIALGMFNLTYPFIFIANSIIMKFCFRIKMKQILIYDIAAAALQNSVAKFSTMFFLFGPLLPFDRTVVMLLLSDIVFVLVCAAFYAFYIRRAERESDLMVNNLKFGILLTVTIAVMFILSQLGDALILEIPGKIVYMSSLVIIDLMVLFAEFGVFEQNRLEQENSLVEKMLSLQKEQHQLFEDNIELINRKCHDMRHQLSLLKDIDSSAEREKYIAEIEGSIRLYDQEVKTGNKVLDIVLSKYSLLCEENKVRFTYMADGGALAFMENSDLYSFFGNALENAVESLKKEEDETKRLLSVIVKRQKSVIIINIENYYSGTLELSGKLPPTTKKSDGYHGFGLKSIRFIAEKYGGQLHLDVKSGFFILQAIFPDVALGPSSSESSTKYASTV